MYNAHVFDESQYETAAEVAKRWRREPETVKLLCRTGRLTGAVKRVVAGRPTWYVPRGMKRPALRPGRPLGSKDTRPRVSAARARAQAQ